MRRMAVSAAVNGKRQHPGEKEAAFERRRRKQLLLLLWVPLFCWWLQNIDGTTGFALVDKMNRFSTADKLNRSRPATVTNGPRTRTRSGSTDGGQQSYKDQLLSVILQQNSANTSSFAYPAPPSSLVSEQSEHPQFEQVIEEPPNGNMKSKDFGNGEGELDMLFGFFLMNGACIVFFLLFGVCVICNCAARKPKFAGNEQKEKKRKKPTVSRLVAAMAPPGFGQRAKANKAAAAAEQQQNSISGNIPMLHTNGGGGSRRGSTASIRLDQNGNGGGGCLPMAGTPLLSNHSPAQRSFKSLVTRAVAMAKMDTGGKQLAMDLEDATAREGVVESRPPTTAEQRRQSKEMAPFQGSGGNTPARRMSTFSTTIEEPTRRISKLSHCSANECCSLHVLEVPVEVEVHHCPASPTRGSPLLPDLEAALGSAHQKLAYTRSMPLDLAKAAGRLAEPQQICLTEHGQFIVRRETQSSWTGASRPYQSRHRCSLVVPIQMPCGECRVQISSEEEEEDQQQNRKAQKQKEPEEGDGNEEKADGQSSTGSGSRKPSASGGEFSVVRQNLLGPLSFDDLYYIS